MAKQDKPPFRMQLMLRLDRGSATAADTLRRYAPLADEIGADGMDVDVQRADLLLSGYRVAVNEERAMHDMAHGLLRRFGWTEQDLAYRRYHRWAETGGPPPGPPANHLMIVAADQEMGWEGATHGVGLTPDRTLDVDPADSDCRQSSWRTCSG
ncbi:hypothetical protein GA0070564_101609 [Micromonospora mirobrigensis]|uniref:Uncharacterized protein n=1 Tax=Micromonospora mirobrigensis TaxID=262898 RepID=A0A1C4UNC2_9ACTN|nr:hypothetical protein GA0070564_101609 [Micromonospora mirobrigensis]